jgi:hypothetical protein
MSLVIAVYVREGIVMASDSRLTLNAQSNSGGVLSIQLSVGMTDSNYKTFVTGSSIGISTYGAADIGGVPIAGFIESFIQTPAAASLTKVQDLSKEILSYFRNINPALGTFFLVGGYDPGQVPEQEVWYVSVADNVMEKVNKKDEQGAKWGGEVDVLSRLITPSGALDGTGKLAAPFPSFPIPWNFFTLQDAIDFAVFGIRSTSDVIRFQQRAKTVGGDVDVLVIKPSGTTWVKRKELEVR